MTVRPEINRHDLERGSAPHEGATTQRRAGLPVRKPDRDRTAQKQKRKEVLFIAEQVFMRVDEVAAELGVSNSYAYKLIRELNKELKAAGCIVINGRVDRKFFHEHLYATQKMKED